jgi:4-hydroxy-tetrahydrodipicolinate reductase
MTRRGQLHRTTTRNRDKAIAAVFALCRHPETAMRGGGENMADIRMGVIGCTGRMGRMLVATIVGAEDCVLAGGCASANSTFLGHDLGDLAGLPRLGLEVGDDAAKVIDDCDVAIEFTNAEATTDHVALAAERGKPIVIGTTGLTGQQETALRLASERIPIVWAANTSLGINLLLGLVAEVAARLGPEWDIEIVEMHHKHKADAPSGTALALGRAAAVARGVTLDAVAQRGRDGITGPRKPGDIGFAALRGGDAVGDHSVIFAGAGERLELTHRATNRGTYATGAVRAARWLVGRPPGLYGMKEVLGL